MTDGLLQGEFWWQALSGLLEIEKVVEFVFQHTDANAEDMCAGFALLPSSIGLASCILVAIGTVWFVWRWWWSLA